MLAASHKEELIKELRVSCFSVLVDESTDISANKSVCSIVRFFSKKISKIRTTLYKLTELYSDNSEGQGTGAHLYETSISVFTNPEIPLTNIIGFASDGCNLMISEHNSVSSRFREACPRITIMKCICHSLHLCCSNTCYSLPRSCEDLARNIFRLALLFLFF